MFQVLGSLLKCEHMHDNFMFRVRVRVRVNTLEVEFLASLLKRKNIQDLFLEFGTLLFLGLGLQGRVRFGVRK